MAQNPMTDRATDPATKGPPPGYDPVLGHPKGPGMPIGTPDTEPALQPGTSSPMHPAEAPFTVHEK